MSAAERPQPKGLPFGLSAEQPVFDRVTDLARELLGGYASALAIVHQGRMWRSDDREGRLPRTSRLATQVITSGEPLWVEDLTRDPIAADHPLVGGGGRLRFYAGVPIRGSDGDPVGVLSVVGLEPRPLDPAKLASLDQLGRFAADECARQRGQLQLREARAVLAGFVSSVPASMMLVDRDLRLMEASPDWLDHFGLSMEAARGRTLYELAPAFFEPNRGVYERALAGESIHGARVPHRRRDGSLQYLRTELCPWRDEHGEIAGLIGAAADITDMVEALEETERSQHRLKLAVEIADLHVWELDYQRRTVVTDGAAENFFDQPLDMDAFRRDTSITIDPRDRERIGPEWQAAVMEDRDYRPEYRINRQDGKEVWATCATRLVRDAAGRPIRLVGAMRNITAQKEAEAALLRAKEEAEAANRAKSTFLATMSHEIRTPLNGVLGMAQAMAADTLEPQQRERLSLIRQSGETLLAILNDVLDLSKIEAGKLELEMVEFEMSALARGAHGAFTAVAERKGIDFNLVVEPAAAGRYRSDSTRIRQVLYNLISNGLKFTETGEVRVAIRREGAEVVFEVSDTGVGMSPEALGRLFQKFEQADASTTRRFGGTGLGLSICRELAGLLGGAVEAQSVEGRGTTMRFRLPLEPVGEEAEGDAAAPDGEEAAPIPALRVLAAEDNAVNQLVLKTLLQQMGVDLTVVGDGQQALDAWRASAWDLILMDVQMPVMDGPDATRAIRAAEAAGGRPRTRIVALTANAMSHQIAEYLDAGMDDFVAKPIEAQKLFEALVRAADAAETQAARGAA